MLARKTRVKKKFELEHLREQAATLHKENELLKKIVQSRLPSPVSASILIGCDVELPDNVTNVINGLTQRMDVNDLLLMKKISTAQKCFCIASATSFDSPIVYASAGFVELTGYPAVELIGRNCRLLQGTDTDRTEVSVSYKCLYFHISLVLLSFNAKCIRITYSNGLYILFVLFSVGGTSRHNAP